MLIAIMGDTYSRVIEEKNQSSMAEKITILNDYVWVIETFKETETNKYFYAAAPETLQKEEEGNWEGALHNIRNSINTGLSTLQTTFSKRF